MSEPTSEDAPAELEPIADDAHPDPVDEPADGDPETWAVRDHDPTGLDLAHRIAAAIGRGSEPRPKARPKTASRRSASSARSADRDPRLLGAVMDHLVADRGWSTELNVHTLLGRWSALVGDANAEHTTPESYQDGLLVVRADSTAWATSLRTMAHQVVARLNDELGQGTITQIRVLGPVGPSWKRGRRSVPGPGPRDTYG